MKQLYSAYLGMILGLLVILPGCFKVPNYKAVYIPSIDIVSVYQCTENDVTVQVKKLNKGERDYFFGDNSTALLEQSSNERIVPLYVAIVNDSQYIYTISPHNIDLELLSYDYVFNVIKVNTKKIAGIAFGVGGALLGLSGAGALSALAEDSGSVSGGVICGFGVIGAISGGLAGLSMASPLWLKSMYVNRRMKNDLREKTLHKKVILHPGDEYTGLIFVKQEDYFPNFTVAICPKAGVGQKIVFNVDLKKNQYVL